MSVKYYQSLGHLGIKFDAQGRALPYAGASIVCHVPLFTPFSDYLVAIRDRLRASAFASCLSLVPPESYHMTVFEGAVDRRRTREQWPAALPLEAPLATAIEHVADRLRGFALDCALPLRMRLAAPAEQTCLGMLRLLPADDAEARKLARLRDRLSARLGIRRQDHASYPFHITLGYLLRALDPAQIAQAGLFLGSLCAELGAALDTLDFGAPEFCTFEDMRAYDNRFLLGRDAPP